MFYQPGGGLSIQTDSWASFSQQLLTTKQQRVATALTFPSRIPAGVVHTHRTNEFMLWEKHDYLKVTTSCSPKTKEWTKLFRLNWGALLAFTAWVIYVPLGTIRIVYSLFLGISCLPSGTVLLVFVPWLSSHCIMAERHSNQFQLTGLSFAVLWFMPLAELKKLIEKLEEINWVSKTDL